MKLSVSWPNATHYLLQNPRVDLVVDGASVAGTMSPGKADFVVPKGTSSPTKATLTVQFSFSGGVVLSAEQNYDLLSPLIGGGAGPVRTSFKVTATGSGTVTLPGPHPLLSQVSGQGLWRVMVDTNLVDVTGVQKPGLGASLLFVALNALTRPAPTANVRVLARTDGKLPLHWVTATPRSCTSFKDTGLLCFLTPPQDHPKDRDDTDFLLNINKCAHLAAWLAVFLAGGVHPSTLPTSIPPRGRDHFTPARAPDNPGPFPNVVMPRGWESALLASGRHVALALPVPSDSSHNAAGTAELPQMLSEVHATLIAAGDILTPAGVSISRRPMLGIAAHSNGGASLYAAVAASPSAFKEIWLFDTNDILPNLATLARASAANLLIAGFGKKRVVAAQTAAAKMPSLSGRIRGLPDPAPAVGATPAALAASSSMLTHALTGAGTVSPTGDWTPGVIVDPISGKTFDERFQVLHQQVVQGNDADGSRYLTKAITGSAFS